jgi:hypothetical protein
MQKVWLLSALAALLIVGCKSSETVVTGPNGEKISVSGDGTKMEATGPNGEKITMEGDGKNFKMTDDKGTQFSGNEKGWQSTDKDGKTTTVDKSDVTEATLGLPFYPGASVMKGTSVNVDTPEGKSMAVGLETSDEPEKVVEFYKGKLAKSNNTMNSNTDSAKMSMLTGELADGATVSVMANREAKETVTKVTLTVIRKKK